MAHLRIGNFPLWLELQSVPQSQQRACIIHDAVIYSVFPNRQHSLSSWSRVHERVENESLLINSRGDWGLVLFIWGGFPRSMNKDERRLCATFSERGRSLLTVQTGGCGSRRRMTARVVWLVQCAKKPIQMGPVQPNRRAGLSLIFRRVCNIFNAQFHLQEIRSEMRDRNEMRGETQQPSAHSSQSPPMSRSMFAPGFVSAVINTGTFSYFCYWDCKINSWLPATARFHSLFTAWIMSKNASVLEKSIGQREGYEKIIVFIKYCV